MHTRAYDLQIMFRLFDSKYFLFHTMEQNLMWLWLNLSGLSEIMIAVQIRSTGC